MMRLLKPLVPPLLWAFGSRIKRRLVPSTTLLEYAPQGWQTPLPGDRSQASFWSHFIAEEQAACKELIARLDARDLSVFTVGDENFKYAAFGYVLALTARAQASVSVLDYGGNLGDYYWLGRVLVPGVGLDYHCKELPEIAAAGREMTPAVTWHTDDACLD